MNKQTCEKIKEYIKAIQFIEKSTDTLVVDVKPVLTFLKGLSEEKCVYKHVDEFEYWETGCKHSSWYKHMDVEHKFCPYCGNEISIEE